MEHINKLFQNNEKPKEKTMSDEEKNRLHKKQVLNAQRNVGALLRDKLLNLEEEYENAPSLKQTLEGESDEQPTGKIKQDVLKEINKVQKKLDDINNGIRFVDKHHDKIVFTENPKDN